jgi:hypothetical protein
MGVLRGAKGLLLQALAQEGVTIDPVTLAASLTVAVAARGPSSSSSSGGGAGAGTGYVYSTLCTPSPRIFRKAEAVRCLLQEELNDLLRDIIVPVSCGEKHVSDYPFNESCELYRSADVTERGCGQPTSSSTR